MRIQRLRFAGEDIGRGHCELRLGAAELRVGDAIDILGRREVRNAEADLLDDTGEVRAEGKRRLRANLALALTDDRVPWSDTRGLHAHQNLVWARRRHRHILDHHHVGRPEAMNPGCFHGQFLAGGIGCIFVRAVLEINPIRIPSGLSVNRT